MTVSKAVLAATLMFGAASPALAQYGSPAPPPPMPPVQPRAQTPQGRPSATAAPQATPGQPAPHEYHLSRPETAAFRPVSVAVTAHDWPTAQTALAAAEPVARSNDAKYAIGYFRLQIGRGTQDKPMQAQALAEMIASGAARPDEMALLYGGQLALATEMGDRAKADSALAQLRTLRPNDTGLMIEEARIRFTRNDPAGAMALYERAIAAQTAAGQAVPPEWLHLRGALAYQSHSPQTVAYMRQFLAAAPTPANWHDVLMVYREASAADGGLKLDIYRLMRAAHVMTAGSEYMEYWQVANGARLFGEAKTALEEGLGRNLMTTDAAYARERLGVATQLVSEDRPALAGARAAALAASDAMVPLRLADAFFSYGQYADAIPLYRAALQKGGEANLVNSRLGAALALAGQRAEAETAFRAVTGPRGELAQFWLLWLSSHPS